MFHNQGLVTIVSGLTNEGRVMDLGSVIIGLLDIPPISGRATEGGPNFMHVSLIGLVRWVHNIKMVDVMMRQGGAAVGMLFPNPVTSLKQSRRDFSYFGARRVYLAMFEAILILEAEGPHVNNGGLGDAVPVSFPDDRPALGGRSTDSFSTLFGASASVAASVSVATSVASDKGEPVRKRTRRRR